MVQNNPIRSFFFTKISSGGAGVENPRGGTFNRERGDAVS